MKTNAKKSRSLLLMLAVLGAAAASDVNAADAEPSPAAAAVPEGNTALVRIERFEVKGNTLLDPAAIQQLLEPYKGDGRSYTDIQRALEALEGAYRAAGYSAVQVVTPEQEITNGVITFQVVESVIGKVSITGNRYYDVKNIRAALPALQEGYTPSARRLSENIRLANENPTRQMDVVLGLGEEENTVDAEVKVQDEPPGKTFVTLDNTGSESTGMYRVGVGYQNNNLFDRDQAMTFNYVTSPGHVSDVTQVSVSYRLPIYSLGDSMDFIAAYSNVDAGTTSTVAGPLSFGGRGNVYGAHYNHYLPRQGEYTAKIIAALDWRASVNDCSLGTFGAAGCGSAAADVTVHPVSLAYEGTLTGTGRVADYTVSVLHNLPGGAHGSTADFNAARPSPVGGAGAPAAYNILRFDGSVTGALPQNWQYRVAANAQYTADALVSSEKLGLVGANAVRGFVEREIANDKGVVLNAELYTPELAPAFALKDGNTLRLLGFYDRAKGWDVPLAGEPESHSSVGSVGVGARYGWGKNVSLRLDLARTSGTGGSAKPGDKRGVLALTAMW